MRPFPASEVARDEDEEQVSDPDRRRVSGSGCCGGCRVGITASIRTWSRRRESGGDLPGRGKTGRSQFLSPGPLPGSEASEGRGTGLPALSHLWRDPRVSAAVGPRVSADIGSLLGGPELRGTGDLAGDRDQPGDRQGHGQAGHVRRGRAAFGRGGQLRLRRPAHSPAGDRLWKGPRDHPLGGHQGLLPAPGEQSGRRRALPAHGPDQSQLGPSPRHGPGRPPGRGSGRGPGRRRPPAPDAPPRGRGEGKRHPGPEGPGPAHEDGARRGGGLAGRPGGGGQRRGRQVQRGRDRRAGPAPQLPGELAAGTGPGRHRPGIHPGRRGRIPPVRAGDPGRGPVPADPSQRGHRAVHGHAHGHAPASSLHQPQPGEHGP